ncbi:MAG: azurin [Steroidobacteraceae bacterium]|nr:azurin [Steroidobacteraceae bacterium]
MPPLGTSAAQPAVKPAAQAAAAAPAAGKLCQLEIAGNDLMQFDKKELRITADCQTVELTLRHTGKLPVSAMGHNVVLTKTADATAVNNAGLAAGLKNDHVPPGDKRIIAYTKLIGGGQTTTIRFSTAGLVKGGDYTFFCSFPGHFGIMRGKFVVQ